MADTDIAADVEEADNSDVLIDSNGRLNAAGVIVATKLNVAGVPVADPHVVGQVWASAGVLTVSAG